MKWTDMIVGLAAMAGLFYVIAFSVPGCLERRSKQTLECLKSGVPEASCSRVIQ